MTTLSNLKLLKQIFPSPKYKGYCGKICIIGGNENYTGAPYYSAISSLRFGADLAHIYCSKQNSTVISSYSPELIVHPFLFGLEDIGDVPAYVDVDRTPAFNRLEANVEVWFERFSAFVLGPGLGGRDCPGIMNTQIKLFINNFPKDKPLIIDADGLWFLSQFYDNWDDLPELTILTPNTVEYMRLKKTDFDLSKFYILEKGEVDKLHYKNKTIELQSSEKSSENYNSKGMSRRPGGQGDILAGMIATIACWYNNYSENEEFRSEENFVSVLSAGCEILRLAQERAFSKKFRGTISSDVIEEIPGVVYEHVLNYEF